MLAILRYVALPFFILFFILVVLIILFTKYIIPSVIIASCIIIILIVYVFFINYCQRKRGWRVIGRGRDEIRYECWEGCKWIGFDLYAELLCGKPSRIVSVWGISEWDKNVPKWANGKRDEIIARLIIECNVHGWALSSDHREIEPEKIHF